MCAKSDSRTEEGPTIPLLLILGVNESVAERTAQCCDGAQHVRLHETVQSLPVSS